MSWGGDVTNIRCNRQVLRLILVLFKAGDFVLSPPEIHFGKMFFWWLFKNVALAMKWSTTVWMFEWRSFYDLSVWWCNQSTLRLCRLSQQTRVSPPDVQEKKERKNLIHVIKDYFSPPQLQTTSSTCPGHHGDRAGPEESSRYLIGDEPQPLLKLVWLDFMFSELFMDS